MRTKTIANAIQRKLKDNKLQVEEIGQGRFADTFKITTGTGELSVLKIAKNTMRQHADMRGDLEAANSTETPYGINHENICRYIKVIRLDTDAGTDDDKKLHAAPGPHTITLAVQLEFCHGIELLDYINNILTTNNTGTLPPTNQTLFPEALAIKQLYDAVSYLHQGEWTHRDIGPENIIVKKDP